ncbi:MAG: hypothetical protein ATN36_07500 [Epulopiscium sp. Nele67-Bin005]|nr:MAG: hypothetical protein ATN36_07500 [Epulopiscium sp. Nele67-Bin005]
MIKISNLNFSVQDGQAKRRILNNVNFVADRGTATVISGVSGSGKTTFLHALSGMLPEIDSGDIVMGDVDLYKIAPDKRDEFRLHHMGIIFQNFNLFSYMNVMDNILLPFYAQGTKPQSSDINKALDMLNLLQLTHINHQKSIELLSGGEQQRVAIIRALITNPEIIVCDEPTANLDQSNSHIFYENISKLASSENIAVIIVSHDPIAHQYCHFSCKMVDGELEIL